MPRIRIRDVPQLTVVSEQRTVDQAGPVADTIPPSKIGGAYEEVEKWVLARGHRIGGAPRETYYTDYYAPAPEDDVFDVSWPIG